MALKKIRYSITLIMILSIVISLSIVFVPTVLFTSNNVRASAIKEYIDKTSLKAKKIDIKLNNIKNSVINISDFIEYTIDMNLIFSGDEIEINKYMNSYIANLENLLKKNAKSVEDNIDAYVVFNYDLIRNKEYPYQSLLVYDNYSNSYKLSENVAKISDFKEDDIAFSWYFNPIYNASGVWSNPYDDSYVGTKFFTYSYPVYVNDTLIAVVGMDITFEKFNELINEGNTEDVYSILMNKDFYHIIHPFYTIEDNLNDIENGRLSFIVDYMKKNTSGYLEYNYRDIDKYVVFTRLSNEWIITTNFYENDLFVLVRDQYSFLFIAFVIGISMSIFFSYKIGKYISTPIEDLSKIFVKISEFDLRDSGEGTVYMTYNNEIGELSKSIYNMLIDQRKIVSTITSITNEFTLKFVDTTTKLLNVSRATEEQYFSINEINKALEEISVTMNDIYNSIYEYSKNGTGNSEFINGLFLMISEINSSLEESIATLEVIENNSRIIKDDAKDVYISVEDSMELSNSLSNLVSKFKI